MSNRSYSRKKLLSVGPTLGDRCAGMARPDRHLSVCTRLRRAYLRSVPHTHVTPLWLALLSPRPHVRARKDTEVPMASKGRRTDRLEGFACCVASCDDAPEYWTRLRGLHHPTPPPRLARPCDRIERHMVSEQHMVRLTCVVTAGWLCMAGFVGRTQLYSSSPRGAHQSLPSRCESPHPARFALAEDVT
jgi:hypothetical protein